MIGTLTLNPCIDVTLEINKFTYGGMNRVITERKDVSGKGINVSAALLQNGIDTKTCGFIYADDKEFFLKALKDRGITYEGIEVPGTVRENIKIWDTDSNITTEVNQSGKFVAETYQKQFLTFFSDFIDNLSLTVLSGSLPKGVDTGFYKILIEQAHKKNIPCILDAEGECLLKGLQAHPLLIKPNKYEFMTAFSPSDDSEKSIIQKSHELIHSGYVQYICITLGKDGAMLVDKESAFVCRSLDIPLRCTQGAGDSVVAGICAAYKKNAHTSEMLRLGCAMAHATLIREGTQMCLPEDCRSFYDKLTVEEVKK
ncbi:1-phosphofructokinase family hexose kinase [Treponema sp. OMZ 840]|uniref:1-phosphofructokinase family hexose kinase n=1 Tax=Treponema sp. OMZ 840 TaxID=244313 RepID=UPI003D8A4495